MHTLVRITLFLLSCGLAAIASGAEVARRSFNLPATDAAVSLRQYAEQSGREILYSPEVVRGAQTRAVRGEFTPQEALDRLLEGSGLTATQTRNGLFAIRRGYDPKDLGPALAANSDRPEARETPVVLSPFEVTADTRGYYAAQSMSGTRFNTRLEDIGASLSVVTKAQMADFALIDLNDIFNYEANTEGTGNYTAFEVDRNGMVVDQIQNNPQGANRIRGIGAANISLNNFATSGVVPIDPIAIDAVEISRGPNSSIFGLGEGSGTVNVVAATASLARPFSIAEARIDDLGGWRTSLDLNRPLLAGKLAVRASNVYQHEAYRQKPAGFETRRFNAMVRFQPFKATTLRASFQSYHAVGTRPTAVTPRDAVSYWKSAGSPSWDPITSVATTNGVAGPAGQIPAIFGSQNFGAPILYVDGGIKVWQISRMPAANATNGPNNQSGSQRMVETVPDPVRTNRPLFSTLQGVSSRAIYDYASINLAAPNTIKDQIETSTVEFEQYLLNNDRHKLALQLAWQREDGDRLNNNIIGQAAPNNASYYLYVDPNTKLLDGRPNPFFGKPYVGVGLPQFDDRPYVRDSYRAQGAYVLDFTGAEKWTRWLGRHQLLGYYEERKSKNYRYRFRYAVTSSHFYSPAGEAKGSQNASLATRAYYHYYVGDGQGGNVDYAPSGFELGTYGFQWYDPQRSAWVTDQVTLGRAATTESTAGSTAVLNLIKTKGAMLQSSLLQDRVITTFGRRSDENRNKAQRPGALLPNGYEFDYAAMDGWAGDWLLREGDTKTAGVVARPFRGWGPFRAGARGGAANLLSGLSLYYNRSDSFRPDVPAISILLNELPNPSSNGRDYGFTLNLGNKFVLRANKYETNQINSRAGESATLATRALRIDFGESDAFALQRQARNWIRAGNPSISTAALEAAVAQAMGMSPEQYRTLDDLNTSRITETSDVLARGNEYELSFTPDNFWTLRANVARQESIDANLSPNIPAWVAIRLPAWEKVVDTRTGTRWIDTGYSGDNPNPGSTTPRNYLTNNLQGPLGLAQATQGKARPQTREWRANLLTSYRLAGFTEQPILKRMTVGGAVRWESKGAIGYFGIPVNGDVHQAVSLDPDRPIYDKARSYFDAFASYSTRLYRDKVRARFQLNVRNLQESKARLQAVGAYPNGVGHTFRIINPRTFIFTSTFEL